MGVKARKAHKTSLANVVLITKANSFLLSPMQTGSDSTSLVVFLERKALVTLNSGKVPGRVTQ